MRGHHQIDVQEASSFKKHVALIHSTGDLSLLERKLFNVLVLHAYDHLLDTRTHTLPLRVLTEMIGYKSNDQATLKVALKKLTVTSLEYNLLGDRVTGPAWQATTLLASAELARGQCVYEFSEQQSRRLYDPDVWALINVAIQREFSSSFALALHENCLRFRGTGSTGWWEIDKFRRLLGATADSYDDFRRLNNKIIQPSVKQVNKFSEIEIVPEFRTARDRYRRVEAIRFKVGDNPQRTLFSASDAAADRLRATDAYKRLRGLGVSDRLAMSAVSQDEAWALSIGDYTEEKKRQGAIVKSPGAYAARLIQSKATLAPRQPSESEAARKQSESAEQASRAQQQRQRAVLKFERERREAAFASLSERDRARLLRRFVDQSKRENPSLLRGYNSDTGALRGLAAIAFDRLVVRETLGDYSDADLDLWMKQKRAKPETGPA